MTTIIASLFSSLLVMAMGLSLITWGLVIARRWQSKDKAARRTLGGTRRAQTQTTRGDLMSNSSIPSTRGPGNREPDRLDRALTAGYTFRLTATPTGGLVEVTVTPPDREQLNPVYGPVTHGALAVLDLAAGIAEEHRIEQSRKSHHRGSGR